jgi:hypothetical protein
MISWEPFLSFLKLHNTFEVEIGASGYVVREIMMQGGKMI